MDWVQLISVLGGGVLLGQLLAFCRYAMKHRTLAKVIARENSTPEQWQAAADALATIDGPLRIPRPAHPRTTDPTIPAQRVR